MWKVQVISLGTWFINGCVEIGNGNPQYSTVGYLIKSNWRVLAFKQIF